MDMQEWALAAQDFRSAREQTRVGALTLVDAAKCEGKLGNAAAAEELLREATELEPTNGFVWDGLAEYWIDHGDPERAIRYANSAAEYLPGNANPPYLRGRAYEGLGKLEEAMEEYGRALQLAPRSAVGQRALGGALLKDGQYAAAGNILSGAIEAKPSDPTTYDLRAKCSEALGLTEQADADRRTAAAIRAESESVRGQ
jgi:tetratricopeptide (TPR) repeat protein